MPGNRTTRFAATLACLAVLAACGGGGGDSTASGGVGGGAGTDAGTGSPATGSPGTGSPSAGAPATGEPGSGTPGAGAPGGGAPAAPVALVTTPSTKSDASRFLAQATFGPNAAAIDALSASRFDAWLEDQFARAPAATHLAYFDAQEAAAVGTQNDPLWLYQSFWRHAVGGDDQLGQRVAFALSEIFVISLVDTNVSPRGAASYLDMLRKHAFGNFRELLQDVSLHPMMCVYLSHRANNGRPGRVPDENYAREVMQLFTIGLYELNPDGTPKTDAQGQPVETYTNDDVTGLAKVFTGWSWISPSGNANGSDAYFFGTQAAPNRDVTPMEGYASYHSTEPKAFLKGSCPGGTMPAQSLQCGLDRLFAHPNVGPFIGKQLIQRLVTSNPSPAYVSRVAAAFDNNGSGVRGDMKAVLRAILLDPEARATPAATDTKAGKVREPILRMTAFLRGFDATSITGRYLVGATDPTGLGQTPMRSPSVFNFWRPGYTPQNSDLAAAKLVAPELQSTNEATVTEYLNAMQAAVGNGFGTNAPNTTTPDVQANFADEMSIAHDANALLDRIDLLLTNGTMSAGTRQRIRDVVNAVPNVTSTNLVAQHNARRDRVRAAVFLTLASPEFIAQK